VAHELLLYNGRILAETHALPIGYVLLRDGRIASIGEAWEGLECWRREETEGIDAKGLLVCPGLIDMHTHGIKDVDFMSGDEESMSRALAAYAAFGVTRVVASTYSNPYDRIIAQAKRMKKVMEDRQYGDMLHGMHMEGPWLAPRCKGGHALEYLRLPERGEVERVLGEAGEVMRTVTYAPELPGSVWLTEQLALRGIVPVLGHTEASFEEAERAILAGARHVTHMYDGTLGYREDPEEALVMMPGMETAVLHSDEVSIELIGCPVHVPKPFFRFIDKVKPRGKKVIVTDCLKGTGLPEGSVLASADGRKAYVEAGVLRMISDDPKIHGNLTGSAVTLNVALGRLREYAGLAIEEAIRWVSLNPAMTLGIGGETGSLKVGKLGDVMVMDEGCGVKMTFVKGRKVFGVG
jgi:N-acetylglucosamine-6-phosphate deacetylase